jgi:hypothetical protein
MFTCTMKPYLLIDSTTCDSTGNRLNNLEDIFSSIEISPLQYLVTVHLVQYIMRI